MPISRYGGITGSKKISEDFDNINTAFNNVATEADTNKATVDGHIANGNLHTTLAEKTKLAGITTGAGGAGSATDTVIGNRTIADTTAPTGDTGTITTLLGWLSNMIKAITGKSSWRTAPATTLEAANTHMNNSDLHTSVAEHTKLAGIQAGAEVNQKAFSQVNNIPAGDKSDTLTVTGGTGITVTNNPATKTMIVTATGTATPGAHASSHLTGGSDPIPVATITTPGLMSAEDRKRMDTEATTAVVLSAGQQILNATKNARLQGLKVQGRTLIDLLGGAGSGESLTGWTLSGMTLPETSTAQKKSGTSSIKCATTSGTSVYVQDFAYVLDVAKQYILGCWVYVESYTSGGAVLSLRDKGSATVRYSVQVDAAKVGQWQFVYIKIPTANTLSTSGFRLQNGVNTVGTMVVYFDELRLYAVSAADYAAIGTTITGEAIDRLLPYVPSGINGVDGLWVKRYGKNLLPSVPDTLHANAKMNGPYDMTLAGTSTFSTSRFKFPVIPGKQYTFKADHNGVLEMAEYDANDIQVGATSQTTSVSITRTIQASTSYVQCRFTNSATGTFNFKDWQLEIGSTATPFQPREDSLIAFSGVELHANPTDGSEPDILREVNGRYEVTKLWREITLSGLQDWTVLSTHTGYKRLRALGIAPTLSDSSISALVKFDGKVLTQTFSDVPSSAAADVYRTSASGNTTVTVSSADSGWGDSYTPSTDEIKAYFNGYQMGSVSGATFTTPYISGTKAWRFVMGDPSTGTSTLPTTLNPGYAGWQPYQLLYRLANTVIETIQEDGALSLIEGDNFIEVGSGYVSRERANPVMTIVGGSSFYHFNNAEPTVSASKFRYPVQKILGIYEASLPARGVVLKNESVAFGLQDAHIEGMNYNPSASYSASYIKLDKSPVPSVSGSYASTEKAQLHDLTDAVIEIGSAVSTLAAKKAEKEAAGWVAPTLLNGFTALFSSRVPSYRKVNGVVEFTGALKFTSSMVNANLVIFRLPEGYRPKDQLDFGVLSGSGANRVFGGLEIMPTGEVYVLSGMGGDAIFLDGLPTFRVD
ncbi:hypothetical protein [Paenibacillus odorifer]|uniref:Uncharacterized protein n=1 Tax=Paenibacillus odorifer TaxID=189426 RepID=A0A1R0X9D4_9BACL|nr:hypothetical protein [Paenibacillus odorifer]OMD31377.1 hypothetical protein BJP51_19240 [Paenibacillus odorifer]